MAKAVPIKKNLSSIQVLKTLKVLLHDDYGMKELITKLNFDEKEHLFNHSVVSKYINTCRYCGIEIPKIHKKYYVTHLPFGLDITIEEINLFNMLTTAVEQNMSKKANKIYDNFIAKLNRFSNKKIARVQKGTYRLTMELFEQAISERRKISLIYKSGDANDCIPVKIMENKGRLFFHVVYNKEEQIVDSSKIVGIRVLSDKFANNINDKVVVYKLTGDLARRYNLRENETLSKPFDGNCIVVSNSGENKEVLFSRLLRYDDKCEILNPKNYRDDIVDIINNTLKNYGE